MPGRRIVASKVEALRSEPVSPAGEASEIIGDEVLTRIERDLDLEAVRSGA